MHIKPQGFPRLLLLILLALFFSGISSSPAQSNKTRQDGWSYVYLPQISKVDPPAWVGPDGGSVVMLAADPHNGSVLYAGTSGGGVFKTTNGGEAWFWSGLGLSNPDIYSLAVDPTDSQIIYAGTYGSGVFKSVNGGTSWFSASQGDLSSAIVYSIAVNQGNHNLIFAATRMRGQYNGEYVGKLYKTSNGGATWSSVLSVQNDWVYTVASNPYAPYMVLAATHEHGPYLSDNYGGPGDWEKMAVGGQEEDKGRVVAFDPRSWTNRAYYGAWHGDFFVSTDRGYTWSSSNSGLGGTHAYPNGLVISQANPDILYMAAHSGDIGGVVRSSNAGASWQGAGLQGKTVYTVAVPAGSTNTVLAGTYQEGILKSTDSGGHWRTSISGLSNTYVTGWAFYGSRSLSSTQNLGVLHSTDDGATWSAFNTNLGDQFINGLVSNPARPNIVYALTNSAGLRMIDLAATSQWQQVALPAAALANYQAPEPGEELGEDPVELPESFDERRMEDELLNGGSPVAELSTNETPMGETPAEPAAMAAPSGINTLVFAPSNPQIAYLGTNNSGMYISTDGGTSWSPVFELAGLSIRHIAVDPGNATVAYAITTQKGIFKYSSKGGSDWISLPDPNLTAYAVAFKSNEPKILFVGTNNGVWKFNSINWERAGLQGYVVNALAQSPGKSIRLFAGTNAGAFFLDSGDQWLEVGKETNLNQFTVQSISFNKAVPCYVYLGTPGRGSLRACIP